VKVRVAVAVSLAVTQQDWSSEIIVLIRPATAADLPAIKDLERHAPAAAHWSAEQYAGLFESGPGYSSQRLALVALAATANDRATTNERAPANSAQGRGGTSPVLGFLVALNLGIEWELENLVVEAASRHRGLGRQLMNELIRRARAAGGQSVFLEVRESNSAACALYQSAGFTETVRRKRYYANPAEDAVVYRLSLS